MPLSAGEQNLLRNSHPHAALKYMSVYVPEVIYCGTITGSPARGANTFTVSDVIAETETPMAGYEVRIGISCGDDSISIRRLRDKTGTTIKVDENGVEWANGQYVTIVNFRPLFPKFPYIEDVSPFTFYKDLDVVYTDGNEFPPPVAIIGLTEPKFLDGSSVVWNLDAGDSYTVAQGATITAYQWSTTSGVLSSPTSQTTTLTVTTPGQFTLTLQVTDSNAKTEFQDRYMWAHQRSGIYAPYLDFEFAATPSGNWQTGGYTCSVLVRGVADITEFPDRAYVVIWSEMYFGGQKTSVGPSGNIIMAGYIRKESVEKNLDTSTVSFDIATIHELLDAHVMYSVSLTDTDSPTTWWQYKNLTAPRAVHHLWKYHSTLLNICDVILPMSNTTRLPAVDDFVNGTLLSLPDGFAYQHGIFAHVCCNKLNQVYLEIEINTLSDAARAAVDTVMTLTDLDRRGETDVQIIRNPEKRIAHTMLSGITYDGSTSTPIISKYPGEVAEVEGSSFVSIERQVLASQADSDVLVGRLHGIANNPIIEERIDLAGNYWGAHDIVPQLWFNQNLPASSNKRGIDMTGVKIVPRVIDMEFPDDTILVRVVYETDATGYDGIPGRFPTEPPDDLPPEDPTTSLPFALYLVAFNDSGSCHIRSVVGGNWTLRNGALTGTSVEDFHGGEDPWWYTPSKQGTDDPAQAILIKCNDGEVYRTVNQGVTWIDVTPTDNPPNGAGDSPAPTPGDLTYFWYIGDYVAINNHYVLGKQSLGSNVYRGWVYITTDDFATDNWEQITEDL